MNSGNKRKENENRTCYFFDEIININDLDCNNILLKEKSNEKILSLNLSLFKAFTYYI